MKKIIYTLSIVMLVAFFNTLTSCSDDADLSNDAAVSKSSTTDLNKQPSTTVPITNAAPNTFSRKLIIVNNTNATLDINQLQANEAVMPNGNCFINNKTTAGPPNLYIPGMTTVTFVDFATSIPSSYNIPTWQIACSGSASFFDTVANTLANYGIQIPNATLGVKYTYWTGAVVSAIVPNANPNAPVVHYGNARTIGRYFPNTIYYSYAGANPSTVTISWTVASNGDCIITAN